MNLHLRQRGFRGWSPVAMLEIEREQISSVARVIRSAAFLPRLAGEIEMSVNVAAFKLHLKFIILVARTRVTLETF